MSSWDSRSDLMALDLLKQTVEATGDRLFETQVPGYQNNTVIIQQILNGEHPGVVQLYPGRDTEELIAAGHLLDLTDLSDRQGWRNALQSSAFSPCIVDGRVFCVPISQHSTPWLWLNVNAFRQAGEQVPTNWEEFARAVPRLRDSGIIPLAMEGGPRSVEMLFDGLQLSVGGADLWERLYEHRDLDAAGGQDMRRVIEALDTARKSVSDGWQGTSWDVAVDQVVRGDAAATVAGDWAQGQFLTAGQEPGREFECLPNLGADGLIGATPDLLFFPKNNDPDVERAQLALAALVVSPDFQTTFNAVRGTQPVRDDFDRGRANVCMLKAAGKTDCPKTKLELDFDSLQRLTEVTTGFFDDDNVSVDQLQREFVDVLQSADITAADQPKCCPVVGNCPQSPR